MIKKLRKKFILINMLLVSVILIVVFTSLCVSNYRQLCRASDQTLTRAMDQMFVQQPPKLDIGKPRGEFSFSFISSPVFVVQMHRSGELKLIMSENIDVSETDLTALTEEALAKGKDSGVLREYNLRYMVKSTPEGTKVGFTEISGENDQMRATVLRSALFLLLSLAAFFFVSLFLSQWALRPVERAWEQQRRFVSDASHELKTPLTVILANTGILKGNRKDSIEKNIKWVENTETEALRMKQLIDSMLCLAKSDEARAPAYDQTLSLSDLAQSTALAFESVAFEQGLNFTSEIEPALCVQGEPALLKQLLATLLDNAFKYGAREGDVELKLEQRQGKAVLSVRNMGPVIPGEELSHVFERFYRADKSRARQSEGYGLGLSIAKSIAEAHRGKITAGSDAEAGTVFTVTLPLAPPDGKLLS